MSQRRLSDELLTELVIAASKALLEKGHPGDLLGDWMMDIAELLQERATLRDRFADASLAALLPTIDAEALQRHGLEKLLEKAASVSYKMADAMLKARGEGK